MKQVMGLICLILGIMLDDNSIFVSSMIVLSFGLGFFIVAFFDYRDFIQKKGE